MRLTDSTSAEAAHVGQLAYRSSAEMSSSIETDVELTQILGHGSDPRMLAPDATPQRKRGLSTGRLARVSDRPRA